MITYDLANRLKYAGFPQHEGEVGAKYIWLQGGQFLKSYTPDLSELIEACGVAFNSLHRLGNGDWCSDSSIADGLHNDHYSGSTPEEAVANLWLELNKK